MITRRTRTPRREEGFTLVELLVVVVVLGILAAVAIPVYLGQQRSARDASVISDVHNTSTGVTEWVLNNTRTALTNTADYVAAGGRLVRSGANVIDVTASGTGSFTVCGYTANAGNYGSNTSAYLYSSDSRQSTRSTAGCPGDGVTSTTTGSTSTGSTGTATTTTGSTTTGSTATGTTSSGSTSSPSTSSPSTSTPTPTPTTSTATASSTPTPSPSASSTPAPDQWIDCASEGSTCSFTGTHSVRYGLAPSSYAFKTLTGGTSCTNDVFGDPAYGYAKQCAYLK